MHKVPCVSYIWLSKTSESLKTWWMKYVPIYEYPASLPYSLVSSNHPRILHSRSLRPSPIPLPLPRLPAQPPFPTPAIHPPTHAHTHRDIHIKEVGRKTGKCTVVLLLHWQPQCHMSAWLFYRQSKAKVSHTPFSLHCGVFPVASDRGFINYLPHHTGHGLLHGFSERQVKVTIITCESKRPWLAMTGAYHFGKRHFANSLNNNNNNKNCGNNWVIHYFVYVLRFLTTMLSNLKCWSLLFNLASVGQGTIVLAVGRWSTIQNVEGNAGYLSHGNDPVMSVRNVAFHL